MSAEQTMRIGVLVSGTGSNLQAIIDAIELGELDAEVGVVISNRESARGLERARQHGIDAVFLDPVAHQSPHAYNVALRDKLQFYRVDYVVMAGYMKLLGTPVLDAYPNRVLNLHPALLPSFPGANGIKDAFDAGVKVTGVTVHFANEHFDEGPIIAQVPVAIDEGDTVASLEAKIHEVEHRIYPEVLRWLAQDRVTVEGRKVHVSS